MALRSHVNIRAAYRRCELYGVVSGALDGVVGWRVVVLVVYRRGTDIFDAIHLRAGRVQRLVALELVARGVGASAVAAGEGPAGAERGARALLVVVGRLAVRAAAAERPDCGQTTLVQSHWQTPPTETCGLSKSYNFQTGFTENFAFIF